MLLPSGTNVRLKHTEPRGGRQHWLLGTFSLFYYPWILSNCSLLSNCTSRELPKEGGRDLQEQSWSTEKGNKIQLSACTTNNNLRVTNKYAPELPRNLTGAFGISLVWEGKRLLLAIPRKARGSYQEEDEAHALD